ncbi:hypothetical protein NDU88_011703 [Pleurodeles waltl]|uniref:Uncharacterized protein n=1 Tax=Pleurodeles waltl TaxID=8319 RepID=A0AAV7QY19_PLEWA|nr:hypothetical protein NDU88_011703 [Pleurodeles waltl]
MFLFALRRLGPRKCPAASLGEAWRLPLHRAAPPGCSELGGSGRGQVALLPREEQGSGPAVGVRPWGGARRGLGRGTCLPLGGPCRQGAGD